MTEFKELDDKFQYGEALTDIELITLRNYYTKAYEGLDYCYKIEYKLVFQDICNNLTKIKSYIDLRKTKR
jgi:hypothetical protein